MSKAWHNSECQKLQTEASKSRDEFGCRIWHLEHRSGILMEWNAHLIRTMESNEKQTEATASKMQTMENLHLTVSDLELASQDLRDQVSNLNSTVHRLQQINNELERQRDFLMQSLECRDKQYEALSSKMEAMERLLAQQSEAKTGSTPHLRAAYGAVKAVVASFSRGLFELYLRALPDTNDAVDRLVMSADRIDTI